MVKFENVLGGSIGMVCNEPNQPTHVQVWKTGNDGRVPDVAVRLDDDGAITIQIRVGVMATITSRANPL